jgi:Uma2 family endonuclease
VIEVGDSSVRFDRRVKAPLYARGSVPELWLVDLNASEVRVCRKPTAEGYDEVVLRGRGDSLSIEALPDVTLTVDEVLGPPTTPTTP